MSTVNLLNIALQNNPAPFTEPFLFEITFECFAALAEGTGQPCAARTIASSPQFSHCLRAACSFLLIF
jgi:hypothetical protein